jgi:uncharacterized protein (TIGR02466 family)
MATAPGSAQSGPQAQVRNLFPTPVAVLAIPDAARINAALEARIFERERGVASVHHSNWGGWQSPTDFPDWCGPEGQEVLSVAQGLARSLTCDRQGRPLEMQWRMNAWANVNRQGQGNEFYYVRDGGAGAVPEVGGEFEIQDPRGVAPAMLAPMLAFRTPGGQSAGASELVKPKAGNLVMFPSWLSHGVRPYNGTDVRISIALNLTPV